ncbi:hypothetical protein [Streptomyces marianii]|uniref:Uncharacterized protein n=1 Tax=Streptomyces marianii TaxID=1817406 RepID=A0A5R9E211_9ACTN|nr:hypothetical protein [Streptomyces marianii]TLQ43971.1 hypothetical protein FEF34_13255 [Streptomyces marianii]
MRAARTMAGAVLAAAVVTGCSGSDSAGTKGEGGGPDATSAAKPLVKLSVPSAYDGAKGWDESLVWVPESVGTLPVAVVPRSETVAMMYAAPGGYTVKVRTADGGQVRWASAPWNPPTPVEGAEGNPESGESAEIPDVTGVEQDGRAYVVAYAHGMRGKDDLHEGTEVVRLAVYPADASGSSVKPLREIDVPVSADPGEVRVRAEGGRLLVAWGEDGMYPRWSHAVDVATGAVTPYKDSENLLPQCDEVVACPNSRVMAASEVGPLVAMGRGGFGVPGRWFSDDVRPDGVDARSGLLGTWNGDVYGVGDGRLLARWSRGGKYGADVDPVWSVHDLRTGRIQARLECGYDGAQQFDAARDYPVVTSPSGRYLAAGPVAFDLERKKGICLDSDGNRKTIVLGSIRDDGTAYGAVQEDSATSDIEPVVAQLDLTTGTGEPKVLGAGIDIPQYTSVNGSGLFATRDEDKNVRISLRRER